VLLLLLLLLLLLMLLPMQVALTATDASGNTATGIATIDVVDSDPPLIKNAIFKPGNRGVLAEMGDVRFSCKVGSVASCGKRRAAQRVAGVATIKVANNAALTAYLEKGSHTGEH
jgi:hypothetical protein